MLSKYFLKHCDGIYDNGNINLFMKLLPGQLAALACCQGGYPGASPCVLGADQVLEIPPGRTGRVLAQLDLLAGFHFYLRRHVVEDRVSQELVDWKGQLKHPRSPDDKLEVSLLSSCRADSYEGLHGDVVLACEAALQALHILQEPHVP